MIFDYTNLAFHTTFDNLRDKTGQMPLQQQPECIKYLVHALKQVGVLYEPVYDYLLTMTTANTFSMDTCYEWFQLVVLEGKGKLFELKCHTDHAMLVRLRFHHIDRFEVHVIP